MIFQVVCEHVTPSSMQSSLSAFRQGLQTTKEATDFSFSVENVKYSTLENLSSTQGSGEWSHLIEKLRLAIQQFPLVAKWGSPLKWRHTQNSLCQRLEQLLNALQLCGENIPESIIKSLEQLHLGTLVARNTWCRQHSHKLLPADKADVLLEEIRSIIRTLRYSGQGVPALASTGNFLEAVNMCCDQFDNHNTDRRLRAMGQHIITITASQGVFIVDFYLAQMTKQRILDSGVGCDVISVGIPPMHNVPLFIFRNQLPAHTFSCNKSDLDAEASTNETTGMKGSQSYTSLGHGEIDKPALKAPGEDQEACRSSSWGFDPTAKDELMASSVLQQSYLSVLRKMCTDFRSYNMPYWFHMSYWRLEKPTKKSCHPDSSNLSTDYLTGEGLYNTVAKWTRKSNVCRSLDIALSSKKNKKSRKSTFNSVKSEVVKKLMRTSFGHDIFRRTPHFQSVPLHVLKDQILNLAAKSSNEMFFQGLTSCADSNAKDKLDSEPWEKKPYVVPADRIGSLHMPRLTVSGYPLPDALFSLYLLLGLTPYSAIWDSYECNRNTEPFPVFRCYHNILSNIQRVAIGTAAAQDATVSEDRSLHFTQRTRLGKCEHISACTDVSTDKADVPTETSENHKGILGFSRSVVSITNLTSCSSRESFGSMDETQDNNTPKFQSSSRERLVVKSKTPHYGLAVFCGHAFYVLEDPLPIAGFASIPKSPSIGDLMPWHVLLQQLRYSATAKETFLDGRKINGGGLSDDSDNGLYDFSGAQQQYHAYYTYDENVFKQHNAVDPRLMSALKSEKPADYVSNLTKKRSTLHFDNQLSKKVGTEATKVPSSPMFGIGLDQESDVDTSPGIGPSHSRPDSSSLLRKQSNSATRRRHNSPSEKFGLLDETQNSDTHQDATDSSRRSRSFEKVLPLSNHPRLSGNFSSSKNTSPSPSRLRRGFNYERGHPINQVTDQALPQPLYAHRRTRSRATNWDERRLSDTSDKGETVFSSTFFQASRSLRQDSNILGVVTETNTESEDAPCVNTATADGEENTTQPCEPEATDSVGLTNVSHTWHKREKRNSLTPKSSDENKAPFRRAYWSAQSSLNQLGKEESSAKPSSEATSSLPPFGSSEVPASTLIMKYGSTAAPIMQSQAFTRAFGKNRAARKSPLLEYLLQVAINVNYANRKSMKGASYRAVETQLINALRKGDRNVISAFLAKEFNLSSKEVELQLLFVMASADVNPFRQRSPGDWYINANRRRWSHIFPEMPGELVHRKQKQSERFRNNVMVEVDREDPAMFAKSVLAGYGYKLPRNIFSTSIECVKSDTLAGDIIHDPPPSDPKAFYHVLSPNWKSVCEPAILPSTTDYCPSASELGSSEFNHQFYTSALDSDSSVHSPRSYSVHTLRTALKVLLGTESTSAMSRRLATYVTIKALRDTGTVSHGGFSPGFDPGNRIIPESHKRVIRSMIGQRLAQGYQIVVSPDSVSSDVSGGGLDTWYFDGKDTYLDFLLRTIQAGSTEEIPSPSLRHSEAMADDDRSGHLVATLSMGHTFHNLYYKRESQSLDIKLYGRRWGWAASFRSTDYDQSEPSDTQTLGKRVKMHRPIARGDLVKYRYTCRIWNILSSISSNAQREFSANGGGEIGICFKYMQKSSTPTSFGHHARNMSGLVDSTNTQTEHTWGTSRTYNWNKFDIIAAGEDSKLSDELHFNSVHFRILPNRSLLKRLRYTRNARNLSRSQIAELDKEETFVSHMFMELISFIFQSAASGYPKPSPIRIQRLSEVFLGNNSSEIKEEQMFQKIFGQCRRFPRNPPTCIDWLNTIPQDGFTRVNTSTNEQDSQWVEILYETVYRPLKGYHIEFRWLPGITCGPRLQEWLTGLQRKAQHLGLSFTRIEGCWDNYVLNCDRTVPVSPKSLKFTQGCIRDSGRTLRAYETRHKIPSQLMPKNPPLPFYQGVTLVRRHLCGCVKPAEGENNGLCVVHRHFPTRECLIMEELLCNRFGFVPDKVGGSSKDIASNSPRSEEFKSLKMLPPISSRSSWFRQYVYVGSEDDTIPKSKDANKRKEQQKQAEKVTGDTLKPGACAIRFDPFGATWLHNSHQHVSAVSFRDKIANAFERIATVHDYSQNLVKDVLNRIGVYSKNKKKVE